MQIHNQSNLTGIQNTFRERQNKLP